MGAVGASTMASTAKPGRIARAGALRSSLLGTIRSTVTMTMTRRAARGMVVIVG